MLHLYTYTILERYRGNRAELWCHNRNPRSIRSSLRSAVFSTTLTPFHTVIKFVELCNFAYSFAYVPVYFIIYLPISSAYLFHYLLAYLFRYLFAYISINRNVITHYNSFCSMTLKLQHPFTLFLDGPSSCGKSAFVIRLL